MATILAVFLICLLGLILFVIGRIWNDYTTGILGGLLIFLLGFAVLINVITDIPNLYNTILGMVLLGVGAYIWIAGSVELLKDKGYF